MTDVRSGALDPASLFRPLAPPERRRVVCSIWGEPKKGKTHFALTFPDPIYLLDLNLGAEDLQPKFAGKQIVHAPLVPDDMLDPASVARALNTFMAGWRWALREASQRSGTVVVDTASQLWRWVQTVYLESIRQKRFRAEVAKRGGDESRVDYENIRLYQYDYALANNAMANILNLALAAEGANVVLIHHAQEKYDASGNPTGKLHMRGYAETPAIVGVQLQLYKTPDGQFMSRLEHFRPDGTKEGLSIPNLNYTLLSALVHNTPDT
jgi:hypothetical protein